jgi:hypothetical protein
VAKAVFYQRTAQSSKTITMCPVNIFGKMQIQWINSGNQAFGFTIKFVRGDFHQRESDREVLWFSPPKFSLSVSERLSHCGVNAFSDIEHLGLLVEKETLAARLLVQFGSLKSLVCDQFHDLAETSEKQIPEKDITVKVYSYACKISYPMDAALVEHQMTLSHRHASIHSTLAKNTL